MKLIDKQLLKDEYRKAFVSNLVDKERGIDLSEYANDAIKAFEEFVDRLPEVDIHYCEGNGESGGVNIRVLVCSKQAHRRW